MGSVRTIWLRRAIVSALAFMLAGAAPPGRAGTVAPFMVIVHPSNSTTSLDKTFVADAFLKKRTRWPNGDVIRPVDLVPDATPRARFSDAVLERSVSAVKTYWQQRIFAGRDVPPPEVEGDDQVVRFVLKQPGAIGYVSGAATVGAARVVTVR